MLQNLFIKSHMLNWFLSGQLAVAFVFVMKLSIAEDMRWIYGLQTIYRFVGWTKEIGQKEICLSTSVFPYKGFENSLVTLKTSIIEIKYWTFISFFTWTHLLHFFLVSIHSQQSTHCLLQLCYEILILNNFS